jgi:hypothetical protein
MNLAKLRIAAEASLAKCLLYDADLDARFGSIPPIQVMGKRSGPGVSRAAKILLTLYLLQAPCRPAPVTVPNGHFEVVVSDKHAWQHPQAATAANCCRKPIQKQTGLL